MDARTWEGALMAKNVERRLIDAEAIMLERVDPDCTGRPSISNIEVERGILRVQFECPVCGRTAGIGMVR